MSNNHVNYETLHVVEELSGSILYDIIIIVNPEKLSLASLEPQTQPYKWEQSDKIVFRKRIAEEIERNSLQIEVVNIAAGPTEKQKEAQLYSTSLIVFSGKIC